MGSLFLTSKTSILQRMLTRLLISESDGGIVQDALAILNFPYIDAIPSIQRHIEKWAAQEFNNPFQQSDQATIQSLHRLFSRLILFIEDYLSKATDPFPPRAYMAVPGITSPGPRFKGKIIDAKAVKFITLTRTEKARLLREFIRYELLCKIYHPRVWPGIEQTGYVNQVKFMHEKLRPVEYKELYCVYEYFKGVYGAIFVHCGDSWLPDRPASCSSDNYYWGRTLDNPLYEQEEEEEEEAMLEDSEGHLARFFEKPATGSIPSFWRHSSMNEQAGS
ncbi:hypothetical protein NW759_011444 [Fusarium solani]|nr:hypothetical protein NW759_011444 [Fusarium solani]